MWVAGAVVSAFCGDGAVVLAAVKGRIAPLRGGPIPSMGPSLTVAALGGTESAGRDDGMAVLIEQQDDGSDLLAVHKRLEPGESCLGGPGARDADGERAASGRRWAGTGRVVCGGWLMA